MGVPGFSGIKKDSCKAIKLCSYPQYIRRNGLNLDFAAGDLLLVDRF